MEITLSCFSLVAGLNGHSRRDRATECPAARCSVILTEDAMRLTLSLTTSLATAALLAGLGYAAAQQSQAVQPNQATPPNQGDAGQQQRHNQMLQTTPGKNGAEEPSSHLPTTTDTAVFVDGKLNVPGAPQDSQTVPAKFSAHNHQLDELPTMANPVNLTDEQKHRIAEGVAKANAPVEAIDAKPADMLPVTTRTSELPQEVADIPGIGGFKVIRTKDKILLVRATSMVVRDEFTY
jgi:hypothetical protein